MSKETKADDEDIKGDDVDITDVLPFVQNAVQGIEFDNENINEISRKVANQLTKQIETPIEAFTTGTSAVFNNKIDIKFVHETVNTFEYTRWLPSAEARRKFVESLDTSKCKEFESWDESIQELYKFTHFRSNSLQTSFKMFKQTVHDYGIKTPIKTTKEMCAKLQAILPLTPPYSDNTTDQLVGVPMAALFADVATNSPGMVLFLGNEFNSIYLKNVMNAWKSYLDSESSFTKDNNGKWLSDAAKKEYDFDNYVTTLPESPYWISWNDFFTRNYKDGVRPIMGKDDKSKIILPNDGTEVRYRFNIKHENVFWFKTMPYSLNGIFGWDYRKYSHMFNGGSIFQSYLSPFSYHNYHCPVTGTVEVVDVIDGAYFPQLVWEFGIPDPGAGTLSLPWLLEVNARGILIINTEGYANIGRVCLVPIGMGEVSSVNFFSPNSKDKINGSLKAGDSVTKGDQIGCFKFGGSSIAVITEDMSKYKKKLVYDEKFKETPGKDESIAFYVNEVMATVVDT